MDLLLDVVGGGLLAVGLWLVGTVVFDAVHCALHAMLRSRWPLLRALAWPHGVHHRWLDAELRIHPELQRANVFCHLIPEYLTQLAFSALLLALLPAPPVLGCMALQTALFAYLLSQKGLDVNHRPVEILDAYLPAFYCPPAYHALHHVHPGAYFSAYTKWVDQVVGAGAWLAGRRYALAGAETPLGRAFAWELNARRAAEVREVADPDAAARSGCDVLLLCDARGPVVAWVEPFVEAARDRRLPREVWALHPRADDPTARHYWRDPRVAYRALWTGDAARLGDAAAAGRAARTALFLIRRGAHFVPLRLGVEAWRAWRRFRATRPVRPEGVPRVRSRRELVASSR